MVSGFPMNQKHKSSAETKHEDGCVGNLKDKYVIKCFSSRVVKSMDEWYVLQFPASVEWMIMFFSFTQVSAGRVHFHNFANFYLRRTITSKGLL